MAKLNITVKKVAPPSNVVVIIIRGPLDTVASYMFQEKMGTLIKRNFYKFVVDLEQLDYISSAGIGVFPGMVKQLQQNNGGLVFINVPEKTQKLFEMIGLTSIFPIKENLKEAVAALEHGSTE